MTCMERLQAYLIDHDVPFEVQGHARAFTAQTVAAADHVRGREMAKVVMAFADGRLCMLVVPAPERVDPEATRLALGADEFRLAGEEEFAPSFPDCDPGTMPPFGNLYGVPVYVDHALAGSGRIVFQAGTHTHTMSVRYADFERLVAPMRLHLGFVPGAA